jgi:hypothetical protein
VGARPRSTSASRRIINDALAARASLPERAARVLGPFQRIHLRPGARVPRIDTSTVSRHSEASMHDVQADSAKCRVCERLGYGADDLKPELLPKSHGGLV